MIGTHTFNKTFVTKNHLFICSTGVAQGSKIDGAKIFSNKGNCCKFLNLPPNFDLNGAISKNRRCICTLCTPLMPPMVSERKGGRMLSKKPFCNQRPFILDFDSIFPHFWPLPAHFDYIGHQQITKERRPLPLERVDVLNGRPPFEKLS